MRSLLNIYTTTLEHLAADIAIVTSLTSKSVLLLKRAEVTEALIKYLESEVASLNDGDWKVVLGRDRGPVHGKEIYLLLGLVWGTYTQRILKKGDSIVLVDKNWIPMTVSAVVLTAAQTSEVERI